MKIGLNLLLWTTHVDDAVIARCAQLKAAGYDGVEVPVFQGTPAHYLEVGRKLADLGLQTTAVGIVPDEARNPISADPAHRAAGGDHLTWLVDCAAALGAEVLGGPFFQPLATFSGQGATGAEWDALVESQRVMAEHARDAGLILAVEPLNRFECYALNTAAQAARLVDAVGVPGYGYLYDTFHANIEERDPAGALAATLGRVTHVHLSENDRGTPGRGHIDFVSVLRVLRSAGYEGWLTIESFGQALPDLAAATRVWRPLSDTEDQPWIEGIETVRRALAASH